MIRKQQYPAQPKVVEDLCSNAVVTIDSVTRLQTRVWFTKSTLLHDVICAQLVDQVQTVFSLAQVQNYTAPFSGDLLQRRVQLKSGVVNQRAKHVASKVFSMNANQNRVVVGGHVTHYHREMHVAIDHVLVSNRTKPAIHGR